MTEIQPEIETVTVTFERMREDPDFYFRARKKKRVVITHRGEEVLVLGPWLHGEQRNPAPSWFFDKLHTAPSHYPDDRDATILFGYLREGGASF